MAGGILQKYARRHMPPENRAHAYVVGEPRLTWTSLLHKAFPNAEVYLVGGTLRDTLLGRLPMDIDLVIRNIEPEALENWLNRHGAAEFVGRTFGTFKFVPHGQGGRDPIDIALPRTEHMRPGHAGGRKDMKVNFDHRLPIKKDLSRRDYTINAMAYELFHRRLIDPHLGLNDLHNELIRAVGTPAKRFEEDATRMLRGLRFAGQLGFGIERRTWRAIQNNIDRLNDITMAEDGSHMYIVPRELVGREFLLSLVAHPVHILELWRQSGALEMFLLEVAGLVDERADGDNAFNKTKDVLHMLKNPTLLSRHGMRDASPTILASGLFAFLDERTPRHSLNVCKRLYFHQFPASHRAKVDCDDVLWHVRNLRLFEGTDPASMRPSEFERTFLNRRGREHMLLMHAFYIARGKYTVARERLHTARRIEQRMRELAEQKAGGKRLPKLVSGSDIKKLGIEPGPAYRDLLNQVRDAQLVGEVETEEEAKGLLRELVSEIK